MKTIYFICLLMFGIILGIATHEFIHMVQYDFKFTEFCFLGHTPGGIGWVEVITDHEHGNDEVLPMIAGSLVAVMFIIGVFWNIQKEFMDSFETRIFYAAHRVKDLS